MIMSRAIEKSDEEMFERELIAIYGKALYNRNRTGDFYRKE